MTFGHYLKQAIALPPHLLFKKIARKLRKEFLIFNLRRKDRKHSTYIESTLLSVGKLYQHIKSVPIVVLKSSASQIASLTAHYRAHRFDLLGSGWVHVKHGMKCRGLHDYFYLGSRPINTDPEGLWLNKRINTANLEKARSVWRLLDKDYIPIDWHLDFKSGYRWMEGTWYLDISSYRQVSGVDIKVPWELSRMQHLSQLALGHVLATAGMDGFEDPEVYVREFRNQVLDFIATNPPRFGVNWHCTMDVGIRVSNWLFAFDLFRSQQLNFDNEFLTCFMHSVYDHGIHIINNLEWTSELRSNHYLANIVGLLFVAAYLPRTSETDVWLAFSVQELISEVQNQFAPDGANFEASTSYHRLSAEMVTYATALVLSLPSEKLAALMEYDYRRHKTLPRLKPAPLAVYALPNGERSTPFPDWYFELLEKMAEFTVHITKQKGPISQIGDNDSGRFFKLQPLYHRMTVRKAKSLYLNLEGYSGLPEEADYWDEDGLDHRHLVAAINGFFGRDDFTSFTGNRWIETDFIRHLARDINLPSYRRSKAVGVKSIDTEATQKQVEPNTQVNLSLGKAEQILPTISQRETLLNEINCYFYPGFGLYIYRSKRLYLAVRCGSIGQGERGGHAHNDQLSFEMSVDDTLFIVDPGTYLYTPSMEQRNRFRSTIMHNTLSIPGKEQNEWKEEKEGLFGMTHQSHGKMIQSSISRITCKHSGFGQSCVRSIEIKDDMLRGIDEIQIQGIKILSFHFAPSVNVEHDFNQPSLLNVHAGDLALRMHAEPGEWFIEKSTYSPGYGKLQANRSARFHSTANCIHWRIEVVGL